MSDDYVFKIRALVCVLKFKHIIRDQDTFMCLK